MLRTTLNVHWQQQFTAMIILHSQHINNQEQYGSFRQESVKQFVLAFLK